MKPNFSLRLRVFNLNYWCVCPSEGRWGPHFPPAPTLRPGKGNSEAFLPLRGRDSIGPDRRASLPGASNHVSPLPGPFSSSGAFLT